MAAKFCPKVITLVQDEKYKVCKAFHKTQNITLMMVY